MINEKRRRYAELDAHIENQRAEERRDAENARTPASHVWFGFAEDCPRCAGRRSITHDVPTAPHMPSSLPVSVDCPDCVKHCACGRSNKYRAFAGASCHRCVAKENTDAK